LKDGVGIFTLGAIEGGFSDPLDLNPSQPPLVRGGADSALPLIRGSWRGFEPNELSRLMHQAESRNRLR
jgi:hypothetical protein